MLNLYAAGDCLSRFVTASNTVVRILTLSLLICLMSVGAAFAQPELWGMTPLGGSSGVGGIFKINADGTGFEAISGFVPYPGGQPTMDHMTVAPNGKFYGTTERGGVYNQGVLFEFNPVSGEYKVLVNFSYATTTGISPTSVVAFSGNKLYGLTSYGLPGPVLFEYDLNTNTYASKVDLSGVNGAEIHGKLLLAPDSALYGLTQYGGVNSAGTLFRYHPKTGTHTRLHDFAIASGSSPSGSLIRAANGKLYGLTQEGGAVGRGVLFEFNLATGVYTKRIDFDGATNGANPWGSLTEVSSNGDLYGMTRFSTIFGGNGIVFEYDTATRTLTKRADLSTIGAGTPFGNLTLAPNGKLFGMASIGGSSGKGVILSFSPGTDSLVKVHDFNGIDGAGPRGSLTLGPNGKLFGTTREGGVSGTEGVLFEFDPITRTYTKRLDFFSKLSGVSPRGGLIKGNGPKRFYGMTELGGSQNMGSLFVYDDSTGVVARLVDFQGVNGSSPTGNLVKAMNGKFYGATNQGGATNRGVLFEFDPSTNTYTKLHDFNGTNGQTPNTMTLASNGKLYGLTTHGGTNGLGVLFELDPATGTFQKRHDFVGATTGSATFDMKLAPGAGGKLYGARGAPGGSTESVIFEFDPATNVVTPKTTFNSLVGTGPEGGLVAANGKFYGTTQLGGTSNKGILFEYDPVANTVTKRLDFTGPNGAMPHGTMTYGPDGYLYGMTRAGGTKDSGVVFRFNPATGAATKFLDFDGYALGSSPYGTLLYVSENVAPSAYVVSPTDSAVNVTNISTNVTSSVVEGATSYTIQLSESLTFATIAFESTGPGTTKIFPALKYGTLYYARVYTNLSPEPGPTRKFTTRTAQSISYVTSPSNGETGVTLTRNISANLVPGASSYTIELSTTENFENIAFQHTSAERTMRFEGLSYNTTYYTRVYTDISNIYGEVRSFTTRSAEANTYVYEPSDGATGVSINPVITTTLVAGATAYTVQLSETDDFSVISFEETSSDRRVSFMGLKYGTMYYSRVLTNLSPNPGPVRSFTTTSASSLAYVSTPGDGAIQVPLTVNIKANLVPGATSYTIQLSLTPDFTSIAFENTSANRVIPFSGLAYNTTYYNRVITDVSPEPGPVRSFTTASPDAVTYVLSPADGEVDVDVPVRIISIIVADASSYTIQLSETPDFSVVAFEKSSTNRKIKFNDLLAGTTYFVRVKTNLSAEFGRITSFTTRATEGFAARMRDDGAAGARISSTDIPADNAIAFADRFEVDVYPNPFMERVSVIASDPETKALSVKVVDMAGKEMHKIDGVTNTRYGFGENLPAGAYVILLRTNTHMQVVRVIKRE